MYLVEPYECVILLPVKQKKRKKKREQLIPQHLWLNTAVKQIFFIYTGHMKVKELFKEVE